MNIAAVKGRTTNLVVTQEIILNERVKILALGILSSAVVLAAAQPPASLVIAALILVVTFAAVLPSNIHKANFVGKERFSPIWDRPKEYVVIPKTFPTLMEWRAATPIPTHAVPRETVGRREPFISVLKKPLQNDEEERVPVGRPKERHGDRVPVGVR